VTRTNRRSGDLPPTPHHVLGRGGRSCPLEPYPSPDAAGPTGDSGDSDTLTKARHDKDVKGPRASSLPAPGPHDYTALTPHDCKAHATHVYTALAPQDFMAPAPYDSTAPGPSPRAGPLMPRTRSSSLEIFTLSMGPDDMTSRPSRHMTTRPPRLMTARPSRLRLGPAMPITRSSSFKLEYQAKIQK
jgi:hypothetical protein